MSITGPVIFLQARMNSSRLPGKSLYLINDYPVVVLAALRAQNTGRKVSVLTSTNDSDNKLANVVSSYRISTYRGDLNNVLERFVTALEQYSDNTIVVRLTADNIFPDGSLIDETLEYFERSNLNYLACNGEYSGIPYGVSLEITYAKHLRDSLLNTDDPNDLEHVTPFIIRKYGKSFYSHYMYLNFGHLRSTIDTKEDFDRICNVFLSLPTNTDVVTVSWKKLVQVLNKVSQSNNIDF